MDPLESELDKVVEEIQKYQITDTKTIKERKQTILDKLVLEPEEMANYKKLLMDYRYIDEIDELRLGSYLRFFRLDTETLELGRGGFLADIKFKQQKIILLLKNRNLFFNLKMDECILFQKNTTQEQFIIHILDQVKG
jgi:hypothetical protein